MALAVLIVALGSCASSANFYERAHPDVVRLKSLKGRTVALAPTLFLADIRGLKDANSTFRENTFVGFVHMSGGMVSRPTDVGIQVMSKKVGLRGQDRMRKEAAEWARRSLGVLLRKRTQGVVLIQSPVRLQGITREVDHVAPPHSQEDNINLPRWKYHAPMVLPALRSVQIKADIVFIPVIELYYGHNAGWFAGQDYGTGAGLRVALQVYAYSISKGRLLFAASLTRRAVAPFVSALNLDQHYKGMVAARASLLENLDRLLPAP